MLPPQVRIRHAGAMLPEIRQRLMNRLTTGIACAQTLQRPDYFVHPLRVIAKHGAPRLSPFLVGGRAFPLGRSQRSAEMLCGVIKIEHLDPKRQCLAQLTPIVRCAIGHFDHA